MFAGLFARHCEVNITKMSIMVSTPTNLYLDDLAQDASRGLNVNPNGLIVGVSLWHGIWLDHPRKHAVTCAVNHKLQQG